MKKICIINGPNLNLLGTREAHIYGGRSFEDYFEELKLKYKDGVFQYFQSNVEGEIINKLHEVGFDHSGIVLNAGGYTHTSVSISDAIAAIRTRVIEVHISNVHSREEFRQTSLIARNCRGVITGFGLDSYRLAVEFFMAIDSHQVG